MTCSSMVCLFKILFCCFEEEKKKNNKRKERIKEE